MSYELRNNGYKIGVYACSEDALDRVRVMMKSDLDCEPELFDAQTGRAFELAASIRWRDDLASKLAY
jgi:hypothetical protein